MSFELSPIRNFLFGCTRGAIAGALRFFGAFWGLRGSTVKAGRRSREDAGGGAKANGDCNIKPDDDDMKEAAKGDVGGDPREEDVGTMASRPSESLLEGREGSADGLEDTGSCRVWSIGIIKQ